MNRLDAAELVCRQAAWLYDRGERCAREANTAKFLAADAGYRAADQALQTFGGMAYSKEYPVERYYRDAKLASITECTSEIQQLIISKELGL